MKKHLSVLMLMSRSTIYKILGILVIMTAVEGTLFYLTLRNMTAAEVVGLELVFQQSRILWVCALGYLLVTALLCLTGCEFSGKQGYTLHRLSVSQRSVFLWQAFYNICCFFLFWAVQLFIVLALCRLYMEKIDPPAISNQTVFLAFYRNDFLHSLLPLADMSRYVRNIFLILGLGIASAYFPIRQRRGGTGVGIIVLSAVTLLFFSHSMGSLGNDILVIVFSIVTATMALYGALKEEAANET